MITTIILWEFNVGFTCQTGVDRNNLSSNSGFSGYLWQGDALPLSHFRLFSILNFIISNFVSLSEDVKKKIQIYGERYVILEHDHKYLISRNPGLYNDYLAPKSQIINYNFYKNARRIITQSSFHKNIVNKS